MVLVIQSSRPGDVLESVRLSWPRAISAIDDETVGGTTLLRSLYQASPPAVIGGMLEAPDSQNSGSFLSTIPGMLTAVAAVVTAIGGLYLGFQGGGPDPTHVANAGGHSNGSDDGAATSPGTALSSDITVPLDTAPEPPSLSPSVVDGINLDDLSSVDTDQLGVDVENAIDDCANGDLDACIFLLDQLTQECADGFGLSCDVLYVVSPIGSDYEWYGATCGGRFAEPITGYCADL